LKELQVSDPGDYTTLLRLSFSTYNDLQQIVAPFIGKEDLVMGNANSTRQRLSATLRFSYLTSF
jgi:hypothetical protein